jgi:PTH1 family peptidyl-tRNA hydrolase
MKLVVGLGNPGREYVGTRHNIGFEVIDRLGEKLGWMRGGEFDRVARSKFDGLAFDGSLMKVNGESEKVLLLKPLTYMNLSGQSVQAAMGFYQLTPADVMVVLDDLALPCGKLRIRAGGSDGGHNGLKDIQRALGTNQYPRLRLGIDSPLLRARIDAPPPPIAGKDYVLGRFGPDQRKLMDPAIDRACTAIVTWIDKGVSLAMTQFNADAEAQK